MLYTINFAFIILHLSYSKTTVKTTVKTHSKIVYITQYKKLKIHYTNKIQYNTTYKLYTLKHTLKYIYF